MPKVQLVRSILCWFAAVAAVASSPTWAQKNYAPGVTDTEIKLGQTMPYSGPLSAYATIGRAEAAYIAMINEQGGINGRKVKLISLDDSFSPPKTVEQTRKLVEEEQVVAMFSPLGTAANSAIQKYLNTKKVPQLLVSSGATKWGGGFAGLIYGHQLAATIGKYVLDLELMCQVLEPEDMVNRIEYLPLD